MDKLRSKFPSAQASPRAEAFAGTPPASYRSGPNQPSAPLNTEKRGDIRYPVSASAVLIESSSRTRLTARAADLSVSGCYLDAVTLLPVGASVRVQLTTPAHSFECEAHVAYALRSMGMVLAFDMISSDQAAELRNWIAELSSVNSPMVASDSLRTRQPPLPQRSSSRRVPSQ